MGSPYPNSSTISDMMPFIFGESRLRSDSILGADWLRIINTALATVRPRIDHLPFFRTMKEGLLEWRGEDNWEKVNGHEIFCEALREALAEESDKKTIWDRMKIVVLYQHSDRAFILTRKGDLYYLRWTEVAMKLHSARIVLCNDEALTWFIMHDFKPGYGGFALLESLTSLATCFVKEKKELLEAAKTMHKRLNGLLEKIALPPRKRGGGEID